MFVESVHIIKELIRCLRRATLVKFRFDWVAWTELKLICLLQPSPISKPVVFISQEGRLAYPKDQHMGVIFPC